MAAGPVDSVPGGFQPPLDGNAVIGPVTAQGGHDADFDFPCRVIGRAAAGPEGEEQPAVTSSAKDRHIDKKVNILLFKLIISHIS